MTDKNVTNHTQSPLGLPNGTIINAGKTALVKGWDKVEDNHVVKGWLDAKALTVEGANEEKADNTSDTDQNNGGNGGTNPGTNTPFVAKTDEELAAMNNGERATYIEKVLGGQVKSGSTTDVLNAQIRELEVKKVEAAAQAK